MGTPQAGCHGCPGSFRAGCCAGNRPAPSVQGRLGRARSGHAQRPMTFTAQGFGARSCIGCDPIAPADRRQHFASLGGSPLHLPHDPGIDAAAFLVRDGRAIGRVAENDARGVPIVGHPVRLEPDQRIGDDRAVEKPIEIRGVERVDDVVDPLRPTSLEARDEVQDPDAGERVAGFGDDRRLDVGVREPSRGHAQDERSGRCGAGVGHADGHVKRASSERAPRIAQGRGGPGAARSHVARGRHRWTCCWCALVASDRDVAHPLSIARPDANTPTYHRAGTTSAALEPLFQPANGLLETRHVDPLRPDQMPTDEAPAPQQPSPPASVQPASEQPPGFGEAAPSEAAAPVPPTAEPQPIATPVPATWPGLRTAAPSLTPPSSAPWWTTPSRRRPKIGLSVAIVVVLVFAFASGVALDRGVLLAADPAAAGGVAGSASEPPEFATFWEAWNVLHQNYVDQAALDNKDLTYGATRGLVDSVGDTGHTRFLTPDEVRASHQSLSGSITGIGARMAQVNAQFVVQSVVPASPAEKAGVRAGDVVLEVDGAPVDGETLDDVVNSIRGEAGTTVKLQLGREGRDPFEV